MTLTDSPPHVSRPSFVRRLSARIAVSPDPFRFDARCERLVEELCRELGPGETALNLGSGRTRLGPRVVNLDLASHTNVHVTGDAHRLPFAPSTFDGVLLRGVLEHVADPERVMDEVRRVLRAGGFLYVEVPFLQAYHESPQDFRRFTAPGLEAFLSDFEKIRSGVQIGPFSSLSWTLREAVASLLAFGSESRYRKAVALVGWVTFWIKYLDALVVDGTHVARSASALFFYGRNKGRDARDEGDGRA